MPKATTVAIAANRRCGQPRAHIETGDATAVAAATSQPGGDDDVFTRTAGDKRGDKDRDRDHDKRGDKDRDRDHDKRGDKDRTGTTSVATRTGITTSTSTST